MKCFPWDWADVLRKFEYHMQDFPEVGKSSCDGTVFRLYQDLPRLGRYPVMKTNNVSKKTSLSFSRYTVIGMSRGS